MTVSCNKIFSKTPSQLQDTFARFMNKAEINRDISGSLCDNIQPVSFCLDQQS